MTNHLDLMLYTECLCSPKFLCWNLIFDVVLFEFKEGNDWLMCGALMNDISVLIKEIQECSLDLSSIWGHREEPSSVSQRDRSHQKPTLSPVSQRDKSHQKPTLLAPWSWISSFQNCEESPSLLWTSVIMATEPLSAFALCVSHSRLILTSPCPSHVSEDPGFLWVDNGVW